jgi:hypothetical protein
MDAQPSPVTRRTRLREEQLFLERHSDAGTRRFFRILRRLMRR